METKLHHGKFDCLKMLLGYQCCFCVDGLGRVGGLALLWKDDTNLTIHSHSQ